MDIEKLLEVIREMHSEGDYERVLNLVNRLLADDYTGTGVYEALEQALDQVDNQAEV